MRFDRKLINACWAALAVLASGCDAGFVGGFPDPNAPGPNAPGPNGDVIGDPSLNNVARAPLYQCDPAQAPPVQPLRRMTRAQVRNTFQELSSKFAPTSAGTVWTAMGTALNRLPQDLRSGSIRSHGGFAQFDQAVQQEHADALYDLGGVLGAEFTRTTARRTEVFKACATNADTSDDERCLSNFIQSFGARALRRPLTSEEVQFFRTAKRPADTSAVAPAVLADVVSLIVQSPEFFYFVEQGQEGAEADLNGYELASRLSYHFWQAPPDDTLWDAAASGELLTDAGYRAQVERLSSSPRAFVAMDDFFKHWLHLENLPELDLLLVTPKFAAYAGPDAPGPDTREAVIEDVLAAVRYEARRQGSLSDLLNNRYSFAQDPLLARIYRAPVWDGASAPPAFGSQARPGLIGRAAFLMTGAAKTRPIMKGVTIRQDLLCESLPPPPADATSVPVDPSPDATTRERVELVTQSPGSGCSGCHMGRINPLGFATEAFDGLGRERTSEAIFDDAGNKVAERPVRTDSVPRILSGDVTPSEGAADVARLLDESGHVHSCFARMAFRFSFGRKEQDGDGCSLSRLESLTLENRPLMEIWREVAFLEQFKKRSFP
ncbi:DUF1592 domain-containing protein [Archangium lansingense]|uniref:DUF1592 domain-containing protein n=1 Tax=Archangium lansingense TaxID=2995310 RepID=A0ABT3ZYG8_9BACT|nr:DUF1592 domain-containing protein [Archangium lansinium]MCY1074423.1 DUF1592 domain-containing protein [Archangium lansinium]